MKSVFSILTFSFIILVANAALAQVQVQGYERSNGTYVQGYEHTAPDNTKADNYGCINHGRC